MRKRHLINQYSCFVNVESRPTNQRDSSDSDGEESTAPYSPIPVCRLIDIFV